MTPRLSPWVSPNDLLNKVAMCLMMWSSKANCCFIFASFAPFHECLTLQLLDVSRAASLNDIRLVMKLVRKT